ncbi:FUSC family protein [Pseudooceanicola sp. CBS1P-1]|uniref:FUSC family protein n=1 Tax=Pseudooceanicola albus TaxID=2692189 RepID=A0A6L7G8X0_9RHOB|nr:MULTISPECIES: FUSC family protein [Pseudooceanicola]MBT9384425.1 FUSC family protein [Pseudooceanicola endophyticus]MXN20674.1 hypothetical protein [Pseudooceanicola albus]
MSRSSLWNALRLGLAAWTAFAVASGLGIDHAFWASMPVWVVAQPWRGVLLERALWRVLGTIAGGGLGLALLALSPAPLVTALVMAALLGGFAAALHLWQGVRSYLPLMSAITIAVVVIPAMNDPGAGLGLAVDRLWCTLIGGLSVAVIVGLFTPPADGAGFRDEALALAARVAQTARALQAGAPAALGEDLHALADLEGRARLMAAGTRHGYRQLQRIDALVAAGLALLQAGAARPQPASGDRARLMRAEARLEEACAALRDPRPGRLSRHIPPPRNPERAAAMALMAVLASLAGSVAILLTDSIAAELTAFSMAIFALVLGSVPLPQAMAPKLVVGAVSGVLFGALYRLGVQPHVGDWGSLVLTLAPFVALGALARVHRRTAVFALDANMCFMLASQAGEPAIPAGGVAVISVCMALGTALMVLSFLLLPRPGAGTLRRAEAALQRDLSALQRRGAPPEAWEAASGRRLLTLALELNKTGGQLPQQILDRIEAGRRSLKGQG